MGLFRFYDNDMLQKRVIHFMVKLGSQKASDKASFSMISSCQYKFANNCNACF